jgi:tetratricopeptide (TPR) repeat protein
MGSDELRLEALQQAAEGDGGPESVRIEFVRSLVRSGKLNQALPILLLLVDRQPGLRLDVVRLLIQKVSRQPRDQRNWQEVERQLRAAEKALAPGEALTLLRADLLAAQDRLEDARSLLISVQAKEPRNLQYRLALARLTQRRGKGSLALQILDQAERELGLSLDIQLARLDAWSVAGGEAAKAAVAKLAEHHRQIPAADQPAFLDRLGTVEIQLGEWNAARRHWRELAALQPDNFRVLLILFDLALEAGDHADARNLVEGIRTVEGQDGAFWRFARAALLIDEVRRGASKDLDEARKLASEIAERRPGWSGGFALNGEIAELAGRPDEAIPFYLKAIELGDTQPSLARRLVGLLSQRNQYGQIEHLAVLFRERGEVFNDVMVLEALQAIRKQDYDRGIALARQVFSENSTRSSDHLTLGRIYMSAGQSDEAGKQFRRAVELGPGIPDTWLAYVNYLVQTGQRDHAPAAIEAAHRALPAERSTITLAECAWIVGDLGQAEALIQRALEAKPSDPVALRLAAGVSLKQDRSAKVAEYLDRLDQVPDLSPGEKAWANRTRVALLLSSGRSADQDRALGLVEQNLRDDPASIVDRQLKATILAIRPNRRPEAVQILEQLGGANLLDPKERFLLAQLYLNRRDEEKYRREMLELLGLKVRNPQHLAHFITYWIDGNQLDQADRWLAELKKAEPHGLAALELETQLLDLRKRKPELLALLEARGREVPDQIGSVANLLDRHGFAQEAEAAYKAFIARDPRQPERVLPLADFLARQGRHAEAVGILREAWKTCRHEAVSMTALAIYTSPSAGDPQKREVVNWLIAATNQRPDDPVLSAKLGVVLLREGRFDESEIVNRRVLGRDPENAEALNNLAWLLALRDEGKTQEALELVNRAIQVQGRTPSLLDTRAVVMIRAGQGEQAVRELPEALDRAPRNAVFALHLAWAYQSIGRTDEARGSFRTAEELGLKSDGADPLERSFIARLRRDLAGTEQPAQTSRKS